MVRRRLRVLVLPPLLALAACQEKEDGASVASVAAAAPDQALIDSCVRYVQFEAFVGDAASVQTWDAAQHDPTLLAQHCEAVGAQEPAALQEMATKMAEVDAAAVAAVAAPPTPPAPPAPPAQPQQFAQVEQPAAPTAPACHPNYSGACVPIASDADCAGGGGNGPVFVSTPVRVVGADPYELDSDGDGMGCEPPGS